MKISSSLTFNKQENLAVEGYTHFKVTDSEDVRGFGTDRNSDVAMKKALFEYIERKVFSSKSLGDDLSSSGYAAHPIEKEAIENSRKELIERDVFLLSWLLKEQMGKLPVEKLISSDEMKVLKELKSKNIEMRIGLVGLCSDYFVVGAWTIDNTEKVGLFASASSRSISEAVKKVFEDGVQSASVLTNLRNTQDVPLDKIIDFHSSFYLKKENFKNIQWHWDSFVEEVSEYPSFEITTKTLSGSHNEEFSFFVAKSSSDSCQEFFVGSTTEDKVNPKRLKHVESNMSDINLQLHPLA
ncbi:MAG: YcaO-like family protein [Bacteriovoracaceae bacterium]|nr:YcaO-like family protein [Bacteriovoracaceae bacterium]